MKIISRTGLGIFLLGIMSADNANLLWPTCMVLTGMLLIALSGGQKNF